MSWDIFHAPSMSAPLLCDMIAGRYEHKSTILTSNKSLVEFSCVLHDSALAAALIDGCLRKPLHNRLAIRPEFLGKREPRSSSLRSH